jgi:hypothetical protein
LKTNRLAFLVLLSISFILFNCEKEEDYRDGFVGTYYCYKEGSYWCTELKESNDSYVSVEVAKAGEDMIKIFGVESIIDENGKFGDYGGSHPHPDYKFFSGNIYKANDSISFNTYQGGLGCASTYTYKGKKTYRK